MKDGKDEDLTQEPEMIQAFRDTWELEIHSYLTYLRDWLLLVRELLAASGSVFVQISDKNLLETNLRDAADLFRANSGLRSQESVVKALISMLELIKEAFPLRFEFS